jgi:cytochrome bd-type quinol oxidase subunit 2
MESLISLVACAVALVGLVFIGAMIFFLLYWIVDKTGGDVSEPLDFLCVLILIIVLGGFLIAAGNHVITMCWGE